MNHPEFRPVIIYDDAVYEIGDMTEVKLVTGDCLVGKIRSIEKNMFSVDASEKYHSKICTYRYSDIAEMKIIDISH